MHTLLRVILLAGLFVSTALAAEKPTLSNFVATPGADGAANLGAKVTANGAFTTVVFHYGLTDSYGSTQQTTVNADVVNKDVSAALTGLVGGKKYFVKVEATNGLGSTTLTGDFTELAYAPGLTTLAATKVVGGEATLNGTITANGTAGTAFFEYNVGTAVSATPQKTEPPLTLTGSEVGTAAKATAINLTRAVTYSFRLAFESASTTAKASTLTFFTNNPPVAHDDTFNLRELRATTLDVLKNDKDADGAADTLLIREADTTAPQHGTATKNAGSTRIVYTPGPDFSGSDTFTYTMEDGYTTDTATVTIRAFGVLLRGTLGGYIKNGAGKVIGYLLLDTLPSGTFSGSVLVNGERRALAGQFSADGTFHGAIEIDGELIRVDLTASVSGTTTTLTARFDGGRWTSETTTSESAATRRGELAGRYTVEFSGSGGGGSAGSDGTTTAAVAPEGTGWAVVKLGSDGTARIKGKLADGRGFSTTGALSVTGESTAITFFDDPRHTRVVGSLTIGDGVTGTLDVSRDKSSRGKFSGGYDVMQTASGAPYVRPEDGQRALEGDGTASGRQMTITVNSGSGSGGSTGTTLTRELRVGKDDKVKVVNPGAEDLGVKFDRKGGRFSIKFTGDTDDKRIKGTGVLIQSTADDALGRGAGLVDGDTQTGKITITGGSGTGTDPGTDPGTGTAAGTIRVTP